MVDVQSSNGAEVTFNEDGTIDYKPAPNFTGTDVLTYTIDDGAGGTSTATLTVEVTPVNDAPLAVDDQVAGVEDQIIQNIDLLANDSDVDGDALTVVEVESSQGASITFNEDGTIDYVPLPNFVGTDTLTYTIEDGNGETSTATITVEIAGQNDLPTAPDLAFETDQDESLSGIDVLASAEDVDGDDLTITAGVSENGGLVNFDDDGQLTYTPP